MGAVMLGNGFSGLVLNGDYFVPFV
jgi:hypothetical protein